MKQNEIAIKEEEYKLYIVEHRDNVKRALKAISNILSDFTYRLIEPLINEHDESKFGVEEFNGYRRKFFSTDKEKEKYKNEKSYRHFVNGQFNYAWNHHQKSNPHHWEYWVMTDEVLPMYEEYMIEMLCDWQSFRYKFGGSTLKWYEKNKFNMIIHLNTIKQIEYWLEKFEPLWQEDMKKEKK